MSTLLPLAWVSGGEGLVIFFAILMLFGAKKLPELARGLGSAIREFSKAKDEVEREITRPPTTVYEPRIEAPPESYPHTSATAQTDVHAPVSSDPHHAAVHPPASSPAPASTAETPQPAAQPQPQHPPV